MINGRRPSEETGIEILLTLIHGSVEDSVEVTGDPVLGSSNLVSCFFDFIFRGSASACPLGFLWLPPLLDEITIGHEGFFGVGLGFGLDPG